MSFRKEIKFKLSLSEHFEIRKELLLKGMKSFFPLRNINSLYFDNKDYKLFEDLKRELFQGKKLELDGMMIMLNLKKRPKLALLREGLNTLRIYPQ